MARGALSLSFLDAQSYERFASFSSETFRQVSERTGIPLELLTVIREAIGMAEPSPDDLLREDEMAIVPFIELQLTEGSVPPRSSVSCASRATARAGSPSRRPRGGTRRSSNPRSRRGKGPTRSRCPSSRTASALSWTGSIMAMYHAQQARSCTANIIGGFETLLAREGIHSRLERMPAICFLDVTGYTRLTQELGDDAAAEMVETLARIVRRSSVQHGGKPIKWLGDGVMFYFTDPGRAVRGALEMVDQRAAAGLPPAHVGLHAGPVLFQEGDYFGQTVNLTSRIADYARPDEVLVTQSHADVSQEDRISFEPIGAV